MELIKNQYLETQKQLPKNSILLYRLGDFYEAFFDGAEILSSELGQPKSVRNGVPMAGLLVTDKENLNKLKLRYSVFCLEPGEKGGKVLAKL